MNEGNTQPSVDSMTSQRSCFYSGCSKDPKWGVSSSVEQRDQNELPLTLFACDEHESGLTSRMREAGTRYSLFPVGGPHMVAPCEHPPASDQTNGVSAMRRLTINLICAIVGIVIAPFLLLYLGGKWMFGWRPEEEA